MASTHLVVPRWAKVIDSEAVEAVIPLYSALQFTQTYSTFGGFSELRAGNGDGVKTQNYIKLTTTLSGSGILPQQLALINFAKPVTLWCGAPRHWNGADPLVSGNHRTDTGYAPFIPDASIHNITVYFPVITALAQAPEESFTWSDDNAAGWSITFREV